MKEENVERAGYICGYYMFTYKKTGEAAVGKILMWEREPRNDRGRYAVAVTRNGLIIGHSRRKVARWLLFHNDGEESFGAQRLVINSH